jgi:putative spermidine/putrescine transport system ATP-binding protein
MMGSTILQLQDVNKRYGAVRAVDGISFQLERGEFLSLLGPSGSGKTTTLQMIAGLASVSGGEILLEGKSINALPPYRRDIGVVFQNYALFPHLTVAQNIAFPLEMRRFARHDIERRITDALRLVNLPELGGRYPRELSGGQQQRVALARAFVFEPKLLLMDEPLGALDKKLREYMQVEIKRLHERLGATIIYVTHDQDEALVMSNRIAVFNAGKIEQIAPPAEIYNRPKTRFVADFVGETNLIPATSERMVSGVQILRAGSAELQVCAQDAVPGKDVYVSIRPERIRLGPAGAGSLANHLQGSITEIIYMGRVTRYSVECDDPSVTLAVTAQVSSLTETSFKKGARVTAQWDKVDATPISRGA